MADEGKKNCSPNAVLKTGMVGGFGKGLFIFSLFLLVVVFAFGYLNALELNMWWFYGILAIALLGILIIGIAALSIRDCDPVKLMKDFK